MAGERGPVELVRDVVGGAADTWFFLCMLGISVALVVMGNTLARLIGVGLLAILVIIATRFLRRLADWADGL